MGSPPRRHLGGVGEVVRHLRSRPVRYADSTDTPGRPAGLEHSLTVAVSAVHLSRVEIVHQVDSLLLAAIRDEGLLWWYQFKAIAPLYRLR